MSDSVNAKLVTLTIIKLSSLLFILLSIVGFIWSIQLLVWGNHLFNSQQPVAEDQPHGIDGLGGFAFTGLGLAWLLGSVVIFIFSAITFILASMKQKKEKQQLVPEARILSKTIEKEPQPKEIDSNSAR